MRSYLVGVDVGTTSVKAVVVDTAWRVCGEASREHPTAYLPGNGAEQDPDDWWRGSARCIGEALSRAGVAASEVAAVGVSSQAPSVVLLDSGGTPLRPALIWMDRRGQGECAARTAEAARVVALTGNRLDAYYAAPKLAWLLRDDPTLRRRTSTVVMASGYVTYRLTGVLACDTGHAGLTLLNDLDSGGWSADLADLWGIPPEWLPTLREPTDVIGAVTGEAAAETGLAAGTPVIAGLVDGVAASLESGLVAHGDVGEMTGQSTVVNAPVRVDLARRSTGALSVMPYPVPGHHLVFGSMVATGGILRWFRDQFGAVDHDGLPDGEGSTDRTSPSAAAAGSAASASDAFAALDALAGTAPPGSNGLVLLPYFLGERSPIWDSDVRGAVVGLSMSTTRADLVRAILEGTAYGLAHNLDALSELGLRPSVLRLVGGGAKGRTWNQIKADVTGLDVELPSHALGAPVGTALAAAAGVGVITDLVSVARDRYAVADRISPDPARHADYQRRYRVYRNLYPALTDVSAALAELR